MRKGRVYKRCSASGCDGVFKDKRCTRCGGTRGSWAFVVDLAPKGAPRQQRRMGGFATKDEALTAMAELQTRARDGTLVEPSKLTVADYLHRWLTAYKGEVRAGSWAAAEGHVRNYILPRIGDLPLQALDRATVKSLYVELRETGAVRPRKRGDGSEDRALGAKTVHNVHLTLHRALEDAVADGRLTRNPATSPGRGRAVVKAPPKATVETWTAGELARFLAAARALRLYPLFHLAAYSGMRRGECIGLRWRHVDLDAGTVTVVRQRIKGDHSVIEVEYAKSSRSRRTIDVDPETVEVLREHRRAYLEHRALLGLGRPGLDDRVFVGEDGQPLHPDTVSQMFERIVAGLEVKNVTMHATRHTHATLMLAAGVPLHVVSRRLGHASEAFTAATYAHVLPQQGAAAAATFAAAVRDQSVTNDAEKPPSRAALDASDLRIL